jgi:hypothetical protein
MNKKIIAKYQKGGVMALSQAECLETITGDKYKDTNIPLCVLVDSIDLPEVQLFKDIMARAKAHGCIK